MLPFHALSGPDISEEKAERARSLEMVQQQAEEERARRVAHDAKGQSRLHFHNMSWHSFSFRYRCTASNDLAARQGCTIIPASDQLYLFILLHLNFSLTDGYITGDWQTDSLALKTRQFLHRLLEDQMKAALVLLHKEIGDFAARSLSP